MGTSHKLEPQRHQAAEKMLDHRSCLLRQALVGDVRVRPTHQSGTKAYGGLLRVLLLGSRSGRKCHVSDGGKRKTDLIASQLSANWREMRPRVPAVNTVHSAWPGDGPRG